jgi:uncharacterized protein YodC (DUF2158 family)
MWQRLKCKSTQYGDNKNAPGGRSRSKKSQSMMGRAAGGVLERVERITSMAPEFTQGDIVQLNSGSPDLTVVSCDGENVEVEWLTRDTFPVQSVTPLQAIQQSTTHGQLTPLPSRV